VTLVCSLLSFFIGVFFFDGRVNSNSLGSIEGTGENYVDEINLVDLIFDKYSLYDINGDLLLDEMLRAYAFASGDGYAAYYTEEELEMLHKADMSQFVGMGVSIEISEEPYGFLVIDVYDNTPAFLAGVLPGDVIVAVGADKSPVKTVGYVAAREKLIGTVGTVLHFTVQRGTEMIDITLTCTEFVAQSVRYRVSAEDPTVGIVGIRAFNLDTPKAFCNAMDALIAAGCNSFVFDMRDNPGGEVKSVVAVLSTFLKEGDLVYSTVSKSGDVRNCYLDPVNYTENYIDCSIKKEQIGKYREYKKVILTDGGTASAAELFTAVLLDYELADAVGTKTRGKGILQTLFTLDRWGYGGAVKLTTGYYNPPKSANYHDVGITPTQTVEPSASIAGKHVWLWSESEDNQLQAAITRLST
jgi:carboxyl-terminal processing protease